MGIKYPLWAERKSRQDCDDNRTVQVYDNVTRPDMKRKRNMLITRKNVGDLLIRIGLHRLGMWINRREHEAP